MGRWIVAAGAAVSMTASAGMAADFVILDSTAAGIEPGIVVDGAAEVMIPNGAQVVVIDPSGETLMVSGPYDGPLAAAVAGADGSLSDTIDRITTPRGEDTTVLGAVRSPQVDGGSVKE